LPSRSIHGQTNGSEFLRSHLLHRKLSSGSRGDEDGADAVIEPDRNLSQGGED
jgi:hypothetical protein